MGKKNKKGRKKKRDENQIPHDGENELQLVQQFLGLRRVESGEMAQAIPPLKTQPSLALTLGHGDMPWPVGPTSHSAFYPYGQVIFAAFDVELDERNSSVVTEVGIATLDARDVFGALAGEHGQGWSQRAEVRHLRIRESAHIVNKDFVSGCPDRFEFGTSEFVSEQTVGALVQRMLADLGRAPVMARSFGATQVRLPPRPLVVVGHSINGDVAILKHLGCDLLALDQLVAVVDVAEMDRHLGGYAEKRMLATIIHDLGMIGWNLHNAGNDAGYTLMAMVRLALRYHEDDRQRFLAARAYSPSDQDEDEDDDYMAPLGESSAWHGGGSGGHDDDDLEDHDDHDDHDDIFGFELDGGGAAGGNEDDGGDNDDESKHSGNHDSEKESSSHHSLHNFTPSSETIDVNDDDEHDNKKDGDDDDDDDDELLRRAGLLRTHLRLYRSASFPPNAYSALAGDVAMRRIHRYLAATKPSVDGGMNPTTMSTTIV
ncbi:MAG: hypothetical protein M1826_006161 [Phylliscum demangeonii]|nr:MAG: hypothetical protein M1826_006161 [Phylliscum demangeonii]